MNFFKSLGTVRDSDWNANQDDQYASPPVLDYYSTTTGRFNTMLIDLALSYDTQGDWLRTGFGYTYAFYEYTMYDLDQYDPSRPGVTHDILSGEVLRYRVIYHIPYVNIECVYQQKSLQATIMLGFSPYVIATDEDDHILRKKINNGSSTGTALMLKANASLKLLDNLTLWGNYNMMSINTKGMQKQTYYDGSGYGFEVDQKLKSDQSVLAGGISYIF